MSTLDAIGKRYMSNNAIFADAFNFLIYDGEPVIRPEELREADTAREATREENERTLLQNVKNLRKNLNLTLEQAFAALDVSAAKRSRLTALL